METEMFIAIVITNICFIGAAYLTNENNADMLLAGYNTCLLYTSPSPRDS